MALFSGGTEMINAGSLLVGGIPTGTVVPWTKSSVATGFLECDGSAVSRSTYAALFAVRLCSSSTIRSISATSSALNESKLANMTSISASSKAKPSVIIVKTKLCVRI